MLELELDMRSNVPIYVQITNQVRHKIAAGELKPGDQLPTVRQVAADLRVNFNTVARAYRQLDEAGLISTQLGRGTYILEPETDQSETMLREDLRQLTLQYLEDAHQLGFTPDDVQEIFAQKITLWKQAGEPPANHI